MSSATAAATPPVRGKGSKKLLIIALVLVLLLGAGGAGAFFVMKRNVAAASGSADATQAAAPSHDASQPPIYLPLDPFVVNLADRDVERYAQVAVTLQINDPKFAERMKAYMPSIRNSILLVLADKNSQQLLARSGKDALAAEIMREAVRPMGIEIEADDEAAAPEDGKKRRKRRPAVNNPVTHVHFANFIIQ